MCSACALFAPLASPHTRTSAADLVQIQLRACCVKVNHADDILAGIISCVVTLRSSFVRFAGTGAGYEHRDDGQQSGGVQNFSEGGGMKGAGINSGAMPAGMNEGQQGQGEGHRHHGGQQGGGMQVCMQPLVKLYSQLYMVRFYFNILH